MNNAERMWLYAILAIGAVALFLHFRPFNFKVPFKPISMSDVVEGDKSGTPGNSGQQYMVYNQPWAFPSPVGNFLPSLTVGQVGQVVQQSSFNPAEENSSCHC